MLAHGAKSASRACNYKKVAALRRSPGAVDVALRLICDTRGRRRPKRQDRRANKKPHLSSEPTSSAASGTRDYVPRVGRAYLFRFLGGAVGGVLLAVLPTEIGLDGSLKSWLYVLGGTEECVGVALVASPELFPRLRQARVWVGRKSAAVASRSRESLRKLLRRPPRRRTVETGAAVESSAALGVDVIRGFPDSAPLEEMVAFLRRVVQEHDSRIANLEGQAKRIESELRDELKKSRADLEELTKEQLREAAETHLEWRYAGLTLLFVGLGLATAGNLV